MHDGSDGLSPDSADLASRTAPETPPAVPTNLDVSTDGKLDLNWEAPLGTATGYDMHDTSVDATAVAGVSPDTCGGRFHAHVAPSHPRLLLVFFASLRVLNKAAESIRAFPANYRALQLWQDALRQQVREHDERKEVPYSDTRTGGVRPGQTVCRLRRR